MSGIGMREQGGGGPSAMQLYGSNTSAGLGAEKAAELQSYRMEQQQKYAMPIGGSDMKRPSGVPEWYNMDGLQPAKFDLPSSAKERMMAKESLRRNIDPLPQGVVRTDPITEYEVDYIQAMKRQAELADFDRYVNTLVNPKQPGNLKWLMEVYPEFVTRRIAQVHDDFDFAVRNQMIDNWGINTLDDLHFKYLVDQGKITGGKLGKRKPVDALYKVGALAPWNNKKLAGEGTGGRREGDIMLPYASEDKENRGNWVQSGGGGGLFSSNPQPMGSGARDYASLTKEMYKTDDRGDGVMGGLATGRLRDGSSGPRV